MSTRPSKNAAASAQTVDARYCHTCGRIISPRKVNPRTPHSTPQKYCSDRCRREKPSSTGRGIEKQIEDAFVRFLGDGREPRIVSCEIVQRAVFTQTRERVASRVEGSEGTDCNEETTVNGSDVQTSDEEEDVEGGGVRIPNSSDPPLATTNVPKARDRSHLSPQAYGLKVAKQREQVRQAARRGVAFGFLVGLEGGERQADERKRVEAVQYGRVVEASFAKGEWGVRWKE